MKSQLVLGGRFRVFEDGSVNKVFDGVETPAKASGTARNKKYMVVSYMDGGKQKHAYIHRLVAAAFVPNPNGYPQVNHKDGNTRNNAASNLEWVTARMNIRHAYDTGLINIMATAQPCQYCGDFTKAEGGICTKCKRKLDQEAREIDRRAERMDRYSKIAPSLLTPTEAQYVEYASKGASTCEIAERFGVSRQCVSAALLFAEKKTMRGSHATKGQETKRVDLVRKAQKAHKKLEAAEAEYLIAKSNFEAAQRAVVLFEQTIGFQGQPQPTT